MADIKSEDRDQPTPAPEHAPSVVAEKDGGETGKASVSEQAPSAVAEKEGGDVAAPTAVPEASRVEDAIHSAFIARAAVLRATDAGAPASAELAIEGWAVRRAYVTHLAESKAETAGEQEPPAGDVLRSVYVALTVAKPAPQTRARSGAEPPARAAAKRKAPSLKRKASTKKATKRAGSRAEPQPKTPKASRSGGSGRQPAGRTRRRKR